MTSFVLVLLLSVSKVLPKYLARKALHMGSGTLCIIAYNQGCKSLILVVGIIAFLGILSKKVTLPTMKDYALRKE